MSSEATAAADLDGGRKSTGFSVELGNGYMAQLLIPADITPEECERVANVLRQFLPKDGAC